ncbi:hypothetical protein ILUMI_25384 [Ignelater luminosus]|uniref:Uncharacterized protein n=1 Tax=Ignelater luminosus TaxID=2038154 RepID=A0A8K0FZQ4_IGNLU|nr:hypothetical protein ILUMI_25384 [Ignelater luminosus]
MDQYRFTVSQIWNADETGVSTVLKPNKIVAAKCKRNVGAMTCGERGINVTMVNAVSASRNTVPPIDEEFSPSFATDRPDPESVQLEKDPSDSAVMHARKPDSATASTSQEEEADPRKIDTAIRRKRKAAILTDTPEKNALQEEQNKTTKKVKKQKQKID